MSNFKDGNAGEIAPIQISQLPRSALQAIYHTVTGKTENLFKFFSKNLILRLPDLINLNDMMNQLMEHYDLIARPTVTVVIKQDNNQSLQYSSFERFLNFRESSTSLTSEVIIKYEFIIQIHGTETHQRCIINIDVDSGLPVLHNSRENEFDDDFFELMFVGDSRVLTVSIDFVDFLVAKNFMNGIEE